MVIVGVRIGIEHAGAHFTWLKWRVNVNGALILLTKFYEFLHG